MIKVWHLNERKLLGEIESWSDADPRYLDARMGMRDDGSQEEAARSLKEDGFYDLVAEVDTEDLETAWELTNHIDESWTENKGVKAKAEEARSSSPGDIFETEGGDLFVCASVGFRKIEEKAVAPKAAKPR